MKNSNHKGLGHICSRDFM